MLALHTRTFRPIAYAAGVAFLVACASPALADWVKFGSGGWGSKWDDPVHPNPATVTWGFVPDGTTMYPGSPGPPSVPSFPLTPEVVGTSNITQLRNQIDGVHGAGAFNAALQRAFATWHAVSGITFVGPVADPGLPMGAPTATTPDIRVSAFTPVPASGFSWVAAVGYGPPGNDLYFPDAVAGDIVFNLAQSFLIPAGSEGSPIGIPGSNDLEGLFLHELGHAAMGLGHPPAGPSEVMYVGAGCCTLINREPSPDDIAGAQSVYGLSSIPACGNGIDDDGDGTKDAADPGCANTSDIDERSPTLPCDNGADDDGDGRMDFDPVTRADPTATAGKGDPGCFDSRWLRENPKCQNGLNDDAAIGTDFDAGVSILGAGHGDANGADPECLSQPWRDRELPNPSCGIGFEIALLLFPLAARWRRPA